MKNIFLFVCVILLYQKVFSQQYTLQSSYGGGFGEYVADVITYEDNSIIITGTTNSFPYTEPIGMPAEFYSIKVDTNGNQKWNLVSGEMWENDIASSSIKSFDNKIITCGLADYQGTPGQPAGDIRLMKADTTGSIIYSKLIEYGAVSSIGYDICYTDDGYYLIAGSRGDSASWNTYPLLTKINDNGDVIWAKSYKQDTINALYKISQATGSGFYALGHNSAYPFLMKYSEEGEVLWWKYFRSIGGEYEGVEAVYDIEINSEGNPVVIANGHFTLFTPFNCGNPSEEFAYLLEMSPDGEIIKRKVFCSNLGLPVLYNDIKLTNDGGILLSSFFGVLKLNADWETEWYLDGIFVNENDYKFKKIGQFEDNSFYGVGEVVVGNDNTDYFIVRIPADGVNSTVTVLFKNAISIYPNPVNDYLILESNHSHKTEYSIYDVTGQLTQTGSFTKKKEIDVKCLAEGVYVIQLQNHQGMVSMKFIKH